MQRPLCTALLGLALAAPGAAQTDGPLVSDRPDFSESTSTLAPGHVQVEAGLTRQEIGDEDTLSLGEVLVRYGLGERLEARLGVGSWSRVDAGRETFDGYEDPVLQMKLRLTAPADDRPPGLPAVALLLGTSVPVGSPELTSDEWQPEARLAFDWTFTDRLSLGANLGAGLPTDGDERFGQVLASASLGLAATDRLGVFIEAYGYSREEPDGDATRYIDGGVTFSLRDDLQLDARVGFGLNDPSPERWIGVGVAKRW
ncbi:MAG TPA: hypothetical protein DD490_16555 [Acidobacteria bacterium]|nr:hypothetical protein [Acidobacteriota bacterium]